MSPLSQTVSPTRGRAPMFTRHDANPLLTAADWPYPVSAVCNPGATLVDGETVLLCRVEDRRGLSHLTVARSLDGVTDWRVDPKPLIAPDGDDPLLAWGAGDARITRVDELEAWVITYTALGYGGPCVAVALTRDFTSVEHLGVAMPPDNTDAALLPRRIDGEFVLLHRPISPMSRRGDVWLSRSRDLRYWYGGKTLLSTRPVPWWDSEHIGVGPPPIETDAGWLCVYHGVKRASAAAAPMYHVGLVLLDRDDPTRVLRRSADWVFGPGAPYEVSGDAPNVVYPTGLVHDEAAGELRLYYGAADACVAMATAEVEEVLGWGLG